ncbi:PREDICTED: protein CHAPERONE-LIKE PROTEIN OF POR1, chloroplastic-like [Nelumbo nucifera]|uniref:Protein CHAPERONE-LIKE PROTEIN OF POR1, chloroplastic-like n=2 Tax=Nelumbo nucifera TaxID=4432 RepID=A0A1U8AG45_NELNU|nr:PREDICTED: protein CHAPERONE-LIKE PROTEIN OF POR1, chloroplastic-like [Nelumbo nucifera]DAD41711.1 TPA_asm: hypothetical protein HUJ06_016034 [Nelumbo nucifera]
MEVSLSVGPDRAIVYGKSSRSVSVQPFCRRTATIAQLGSTNNNRLWGMVLPSRRTLARASTLVLAASRADDSAPSEMSVENALKLLGVSEGASFDDILRAKNSILSSCKDDQETVAQVEAAYDMLLMQSLTRRRAGKVVNSGIRYADVKPVNAMPQWLQATVKNVPVSVETPSTGSLAIQAGVYGALMGLAYANGASTSVGSYSGANVPGIILATSFGASLYFLTKKNINLGKATAITIGGLVIGAAVGSAVEYWLQVDIVPFLGIHSPAVVVSEFILFSQLLTSLYLR